MSIIIPKLPYKLLKNKKNKSVIHDGHISNLDFSYLKNKINVVLTSPPYWGLRSYLKKDDPLKTFEIGNESNLDNYLFSMRSLFRNIYFSLTEDGVFWLNCGFISDKKSNMIDLPNILKDICLEVGFNLKSIIIFKKNNAQPGGLKHRCTIDFEMVYLLAKNKGTDFFYDQEGYKEFQNYESILRKLRGVSDNNKYTDGAPGQVPHSMNSFRTHDKNRPVELYRYARAVWDFNLKSFNAKKQFGLDIDHFAVMPLELANRMLSLTISKIGRCSICKKQVKPDYEKLIYKRDALSKAELDYLKKDQRLDKINDFIINTICDSDFACCEFATLENPVVFDPFSGSGTTILAAHCNNADSVGVELNKDFVNLSQTRITKELWG